MRQCDMNPQLATRTAEAVVKLWRHFLLLGRSRRRRGLLPPLGLGLGGSRAANSLAVPGPDTGANLGGQGEGNGR